MNKSVIITISIVIIFFVLIAIGVSNEKKPIDPDEIPNNLNQDNLVSQKKFRENTVTLENMNFSEPSKNVYV